MKRYITMPAIHKSVPIGAYVAAIKVAKANPDWQFKTGLTSWWPTSGREIMRQFREGMNDRINAGVPYVERGARL
jgi:hypothetical protein